MTITTTPCSHCNVSHVCLLSPAAFTTLRAGQIEFNNQFCILKIFIFIPFPEKHFLFTTNAYCQWHILFNILKIQSWTKMLRKMHLVCLILEYFPLKPDSLKIPAPPKKTMSKGEQNIFAPDLTTLTREGWGVGPP